MSNTAIYGMQTASDWAKLSPNTRLFLIILLIFILGYLGWKNRKQIIKNFKSKKK